MLPRAVVISCDPVLTGYMRLHADLTLYIELFLISTERAVFMWCFQWFAVIIYSFEFIPEVPAIEGGRVW